MVQTIFIKNQQASKQDEHFLPFFSTFSNMNLLPKLPRNKKGFTLFELMIVIAIFGMLMIAVLLSVENMSIARIKTDNRVALLQELYFFSEQLVTNVKEG
jgi:prepilin-type N-terminal cleavage/methylation domain-containing protein